MPDHLSIAEWVASHIRGLRYEEVDRQATKVLLAAVNHEEHQ